VWAGKRTQGLLLQTRLLQRQTCTGSAVGAWLHSKKRKSWQQGRRNSHRKGHMALQNKHDHMLMQCTVQLQYVLGQMLFTAPNKHQKHATRHRCCAKIRAQSAL
jgi:endonuclease I